MDYETILKLIENGEAILENNPLGHNPEVILELRRIARALLVASDKNGVIQQKCSSMIEFASIAYAPRRRRSYSREDAAQFAAGDLYTMRIHTHQLQRAQSPPTTKKRAPRRET